MNDLLLLIAGSVASLYLLWVLYVFVMHVEQQWPSLPLASKILGAPVAIVGYLLDVAINWTLATAVFVDPPREKTLTSRLKRYHREDAGTWRDRLGRFVCKHLLNPFDPDHC